MIPFSRFVFGRMPLLNKLLFLEALGLRSSTRLDQLLRPIHSDGRKKIPSRSNSNFQQLKSDQQTSSSSSAVVGTTREEEEKEEIYEQELLTEFGEEANLVDPFGPHPPDFSRSSSSSPQSSVVRRRKQGALLEGIFGPPSVHESRFSLSEIQTVLDFAGSASVNDLKKIRGVTARKAMCFLTFRDNLMLENSDQRLNLEHFQEGLGLTDNQFHAVCEAIIAKNAYSDDGLSPEIDTEENVAKEMSLARSRCAPWPLTSKLMDMHRVVSLNIDLYGVRYVELDLDDFSLCNCGIISFSDLSDTKVSDSREFCVSKILEIVRLCVDRIATGECYIFEEKRIKSPSGGNSFVQDRITMLNALFQSSLFFRDKDCDLLTLKFGTTATYFHIKKSGTGIADARKFVADLIARKQPIKRLERYLNCTNFEVKDLFLCDEKELQIRKIHPSDLQSMSFAILQALLFAGLRDYYVGNLK